MLFKKDVEEIKGNLESIKQDIPKNFETANKNQQEQYEEVLNRIEGIENKTGSFVQELIDQIETVTELNLKFQKQINSLNDLEAQANKRLLEEAKFEIKNQVQSLFQTTQKYKELEGKMMDIQKKIDGISDQLTKFQKIAEQIKEKDFTMVGFENKLRQNDAEKVRLIQENERLKGIISRNRRRNQ